MALQVSAGVSVGRACPGRSLKKRVASGEATFGCVVSVGHPALVEMVGHAGFHFIEIDFERGSIDPSQAEAMILAARAAGTAPIWRARHFEHMEIGTALDLGAQGVLVPHVTSARMAAQVVSAALYPPAGDRAFPPRRPVRFGLDDVGEYYRTANDTTFVSIMIEDREAIDAIDEIAAVPGLDCLVIGTWDLSRSLGVPLQTRHSKMLRAVDKVLTAAHENGISCSIPPESPEDAAHWFKRGITVFESATLDGLVTSAAAGSMRAMSDAVETSGKRRKKTPSRK